MKAEEIRKAMVAVGIAQSEKDLDWLSDDYIEEHNKKAKEKKPLVFNEKGEGKDYTDYGNHFYISDNGKTWNWDSGENTTGGNLNCGRNHSWYYTKRLGDSYIERGKCPAGYTWYELSIYH